MIEHYLWLTPAIVLAILLLFRFVACALFYNYDDYTFGYPYPAEVAKDLPAGYWLLQGTVQSGGGRGFARVRHAVATSSGGPNAATTNPADTTGATLLIVSAVDFDHDSSTDSVSDSFGNTWQALQNSVDP